MVWEATRVAAKSWAEVVAFYRGLEDRNDDFRPLRELAEHVAAQGYAASIVAATSGTALLVAAASGGPVGVRQPATEALRVDVDLSGSVRLFVPAGVQRNSRAATLVVDGVVIGSFERFLGDAMWIA
jgi:hypothetical protein